MTCWEVALINITPELCRAARGLLNWPQVRLASKSGMSEGTVRDFESGRRVPNSGELLSIQQALELAGVIMIADGQQTSGGPGVRLKNNVRRKVSLADGEAGIIANCQM
jgi:transcriptional regulator with XRE-family HTH domain